MTFQPAIALGGFIGFSVFEQSAARQREAFANNPVTQRELDYFRDNIGSVESAADLVQDRRLLQVVLSAFGLDEEINRQAIVRRALEEGTEEQDAFANRLPDPRFRALADAFGFGNEEGSRINTPGFVADIEQRFLARAFEVRVGDVEPDFRLALNFRRDIAAIASSESVDRNGVILALAQRPLRIVLQGALGLPDSISALDLDRQEEIFQDRLRRTFGDDSVAVFNDPEKVEEAIRRFLVRRDLENGPSPLTPGASAVSILSSNPGQSFQAINLILSNASSG